MNITIVRNTDQTLTFTKTGDYSGDTVKFTVKADKTLTSARVIDKTASVSYSAPTSTITVALTPSDSASLSNDTYYYDLRVENSSTDRESLEDGIVYLDKSVRNDTDGASVTSTSNVTTLTGADFDANDTLVSDGTDFVGKSVSEMKTLLGITGYPKVIYYGTISQSSTNNPTITASQIDTAEIGALTRTGAGAYAISFTDVPYPQTMIDIQANSANGRFEIYTFGNTVYINQKDSSGNGIDGFTIQLSLTQMVAES